MSIQHQRLLARNRTIYMGAIVFIVAVMGCSRREDDYVRYEQRAWDLMQQDNRDELLSTTILSNLNRAIELAPDRVSTDSYALRAISWVMIDEYDKEFQDNMVVIQREPNDPKRAIAYVSIANHLAAQKEFQQAMEYIDHAINLAPDNAIARATRALLYSDMGMHDKWEEEIRIAIELDPSVTNIISHQVIHDRNMKNTDYSGDGDNGL